MRAPRDAVGRPRAAEGATGAASIEEALLAGERESGPEEGMGGTACLPPLGDERELCSPERFRLRIAPAQTVEEAAHERRGGPVFDGPEGREDAAGAGELERLPQSGDALAVCRIADCRPTVAQHDEFGAAQVESDDVVPVDDPRIALSPTTIRPGERQAGVQERVRPRVDACAGLPGRAQGRTAPRAAGGRIRAWRGPGSGATSPRRGRPWSPRTPRTSAASPRWRSGQPRRRRPRGGSRAGGGSAAGRPTGLPPRVVVATPSWA